MDSETEVMGAAIDAAQENIRLRDALHTLICVVGLTAFKYEAQRAALQEAVDLANKVLKGEVTA
jgi:Ca2+/H+ antiporter